jgi:hypothetical protein
VLGIEPRAYCIPSKHSTTEPHLSPLSSFLICHHDKVQPSRPASTSLRLTISFPSLLLEPTQSPRAPCLSLHSFSRYETSLTSSTAWLAWIFLLKPPLSSCLPFHRGWTFLGLSTVHKATLDLLSGILCFSQSDPFSLGTARHPLLTAP